MKKNEILRAYGQDYKNMTMRLLEKSDLEGEIKRKLAAGCKSGSEDVHDALIAIKPNVLGCNPPEFGATTHPEVVAGIIEYLHEKGYRNLMVIEGSWVGDKTPEAYEICGYVSMCRGHNVKLVDAQQEPAQKVDCCGMELKVVKIIDDADFLINVPVLKGHCQTQITCALKNMKGLLPNSEKRRFHIMGLHNPIAHLNTYVHQDFIVIDHICGDADSEGGGNPVVRNCVMTSLDPVLTDAYTANLLGYGIDEVEYIGLAEKLGVGSSDLDKLKVITVEGESCEGVHEPHSLDAVKYQVNDDNACSTCYEMTIEALRRLKEEGCFEHMVEAVSIGQGFRGHTGSWGIGNCTRLFEKNVPGCPPKSEEIYEAVKKWLKG